MSSITTSTASPTSEIPAYLLKHFKRIAKAEGFLDYSIEHEAGSKHGDGFLSELLRITLTGNRRVNGVTLNDQKLALICKLAPQNIQRQEQCKTNLVFDREVLFYSKVLPMLQRFQLEKGLTEADGFFGYPQYYGSSNDPVTNEYVIIMRDLVAGGFLLWDKLEPIRFENVKLLMEQLGRVHGLSFALRDQRPKDFQLIRDLDDIMMDMFRSDVLGPMFNASYDQAISALDNEEDVRLIKSLKSSYLEWLAVSLGKSYAEPFSVLGHGDCWNNNMMFANTNAGPEKICLLDWQICRFVSPVLDLSYFLMSSTDKALRDRHFDEFIQIYYDNLAQTIRKCGSKPEQLFTFADLQSEFRKFGKYGVIMAPCLLQVLVSDPSNIVDMNVLANDADNSSANKNIANFDEKSLQKYKERLTDVIADAKKYGWI